MFHSIAQKRDFVSVESPINSKLADQISNFGTPYFDRFIDRLPYKPYCSDNLDFGLQIRKRATALEKRYIQHNAPVSVSLLNFDIDIDNSANAWLDAHLPPPTFVIQNPKNGRCHIAYGIITPIITTDEGRQAPIRYLAAIQAAYAKALGADIGYCGLVMKNPLHESWRTLTPAMGAANQGYYELCELAEHVDLPQKLPRGRAAAGLGRNCSLFDDLRKWSYKEVRNYWGPGKYGAWLNASIDKAESLNVFAKPLHISEIRAIAKSVAGWVWKTFTPKGLQDLIDRTHTPEIQSERGKKGAIKSAQVRAEKANSKAIRARELRDSGMTQDNIAIELNTTRMTVSRWLKK